MAILIINRSIVSEVLITQDNTQQLYYNNVTLIFLLHAMASIMSESGDQPSEWANHLSGGARWTVTALTALLLFF